MRYLLVLSLLFGCGSTLKTTERALWTTHKAARVEWKAARAELHQRCMRVAERCGEAQDSVCEQLVQCTEKRRAVASAFEATILTVARGLAALQVVRNASDYREQLQEKGKAEEAQRRAEAALSTARTAAGAAKGEP